MVAEPEVNSAELLSELFTFSKAYGERADNLPAHVEARDYLAERFQSFGYTLWRQPFETGLAQENIVGIKWGQVTDEWVVVGAHYDMATKDCSAGNQANQLPEPIAGMIPNCPSRAYSEGAYDDGSGTIMTMHLAEKFAPLTTYYSIAFVAFDGEERGLEGSGAFLEAMIDGNHTFGNVTIRAMLDLDMIGLNWPGVDVPIYFDSNSAELQERLRAKATEMDMPEDAIKYQGISLGRSDYAHFFRQGIPTGFFISDFEEWQLPNDIPANGPTSPEGSPVSSAYPFWHLEDTYETMEMMAGNAGDLETGFQAATQLAASQLAFMASDVFLSGQVVE